MALDKNDLVRLFKQFQIDTYNRCETSTKAKKDIVGEEYENFRSKIYESYGLKILSKKEVEGIYKPDLTICSGDKIVAFEEAKGHYLDKCFMTRAVVNFAQIIEKFLEQNKEVPFLIISCPTKYNLYEDNFAQILKIFRSDIKDILSEKVVYLHSCNHDRVKDKLYLKSESYFEQSDDLFEKEIKFIEENLYGK